MVRILSFVAVLFASAFTVEAGQYCQCLFQDKSHCCVYSDAAIGNLNCHNVCLGAHRADGKTNPHNPLEAGTACNANGNYVTIGAITAQGRTPCYKQ
ncbi:Ff.00g086230.m01.CDS01 [Fusarium sp. VM40]|nr:Ff.00g086230.m01.CDS01 [Fusarium sp. VM40]